MSVNQGELISSSWNATFGKVNDNTFNASPLFDALKESFRKKVDGGAYIEETLAISENPNVGFIAPTGVIPTEISETFDSATYTPRLLAGTVNIPKTDMLRNAGSAAKFDFKAEKLKNQHETAIKVMNRALYSDGSSPNSIDGLGRLASSNASAYIVGNINPLTYSFWRNVAVSGANTATAYDNLRNAMRTSYNYIARGDEGDAPTHALTTLDIFGGYESILIANERYTKSGSKQQGANGGFDGDALLFKKTLVRPDEDCTSGDMFLINPKWLKLVYYNWLEMEKPVDPNNQLVTTYKISTYAQLVTGNRRKLGRIFNIA